MIVVEAIVEHQVRRVEALARELVVLRVSGERHDHQQCSDCSFHLVCDRLTTREVPLADLSVARSVSDSNAMVHCQLSRQPPPSALMSATTAARRRAWMPTALRSCVRARCP
jgi:hypothetical protein